jgi:hypothetical protein
MDNKENMVYFIKDYYTKVKLIFLF